MGRIFSDQEIEFFTDRDNKAQFPKEISIILHKRKMTLSRLLARIEEKKLLNWRKIIANIYEATGGCENPSEEIRDVAKRHDINLHVNVEQGRLFEQVYKNTQLVHSKNPALELA